MTAGRTVTEEAGKKPPRRRKLRQGRAETGAVVTAANCALGGITTVYVTSHSIPVTLTAAVAAVILAGLAVIRRNDGES